MADHSGATNNWLSDQTSSRYSLDIGVAADRIVPPDSFTHYLFNTTVLSGVLSSTGDSLEMLPYVTHLGNIDYGHGINWFERLLINPTVLELGNILSTVTYDLEIYNSYRDTDRTLTSATNNAGTGITFPDLPTLPATLYAQSSLIVAVRVSTQGQPTIEGTLDFGSSDYTMVVAVTGNRTVVIAYRPEGTISELLEFLTDTTRSANGKEQRVRVLNNPRQTIDYRYSFNDDAERRRMEAFLYKWHPQTFGIPIWFEAKKLTTAASSGATTLYFPTTYADFRVDGMLIVWTDYQTYDALQIDTIAADHVTLTSPITRDYAAGTRVMPLRTGITKQEIAGDKFPVNLYELTVKFHITDNEVDLADDAAFSTHNGKVMFNDPNWISRGTLTDTLKNVVHHLDNLTASPIQFSDWVNSHFISSKGFFCRNAQALWEMRQILHFLGGAATSFYLPTFYGDLVVTGTLTSGSTTMDIEHMRYSDFIDGNEPNKSLYIVLTNGTIITREVVSSSEIDATTERLVVDSAWSSTIQPNEIRQVSFLRLCRFADDKFEIQHNNAGQATCRSTVWGVLQ